jgi:hypothetical protein
MSKLTRAATLWRGYSGVGLKDDMLRPDAMGFRGGVDSGFQSWTKGKVVSFQYASSGGAGMLYEVSAGLIDRGADFAWLSQYPHEQEVTYAPLTAVEILSTRVEAAVLVVEVRMNINLRALTIDQQISKMKASHLGLLSILKDELVFDSAPQESLDALAELRKQAAALPHGHYNSAYNYELATTKALKLKGALEAAALRAEIKKDATFELAFLPLSVAGQGLRPTLGPPAADRTAAFRAEHCTAADSQEPFALTGVSWSGTSTPEAEWWAVVDPERGLEKLSLDKYTQPIIATTGLPTDRMLLTPAELEQLAERLNAELRARGQPRVTVTCCAAVRACTSGEVEPGPPPLSMLRLTELTCSVIPDTGTMFVKYNPCLRAANFAEVVPAGTELVAGQPQLETMGLAIWEAQADGSRVLRWRNRYNTTLHILNDALARLSKLTRATKVYRGNRSAAMPDCFFTPDEKQGMRGGVEAGVLSGTRDREVALAWSEGALVFEFQTGVGALGVDLAEHGLSQIPTESEVTFPAGLAIEVVRERVEGGALVLECNVSADLPDEIHLEDAS